ncbi:hypothetical protein FKW77_003040 [Venturia effusa]|uniref:Uncharacterized protein n=1 Tax=Venturia effusa TaxID=50376 RepID=A0A517L8V8_9PEZI|nr:hypothetical protein FKW77_003040 [Venturia effusa]
MFRKPISTNPTSKPPANPAPTKTPIITRGNVASLVQLHNARVQEQEASATAPAISRSGTGIERGTGRAETFRDAPNISPASGIPSWRPQYQEAKDGTSPCQSRRKSQTSKQSAIPRGHSPLTRPSRRASTKQHQEPEDIHREQQSRRSITGIHARDQYAWQQDSSTIARKDPWSKRASSQRKPSSTISSQFEAFRSVYQPPPADHLDSHGNSRRNSRRDSWARKPLPPAKVQPMPERSMPSISDHESREWSLDHTSECKDDWATRRTSSERSRSSYTDSRQGLFYGNLTQPAPPAPSELSASAERSNPFLRRNGSGSTMRSASPFAGREPMSRKAFERVRSMSPPSISEKPELQIPAPQRPSQPSIATYITRKLSQHWTDPPLDNVASPPLVRVPPSSPHPVHHIDSFFVQDILSSIDSVLTEHTTALQTVIAQSHQLLHEKERLCPSISPRRSPKANSPVQFSPTHSVKSEHNSRSVSPTSQHLQDPPKQPRRRATSVPKIVKLIDNAASDMGLTVATVDKRNSIALAHKLAAERRDSLPKSITEPDLTIQSHNQTAAMARFGTTINRKASRTVTPPRIRVSEESQPLQPPNTRAPSPGGDRPVLSRAAVDGLPSACRSRPVLPTLSIMTPSTPSTVAPRSPEQQTRRSAPYYSVVLQESDDAQEGDNVQERDDAQPGQPVLSPGDNALSPGGQSLISPSEYAGLESQESSPNMFTHSNLPTPSEAHYPLMLDAEHEYDRDAALVQRATRSGINSIPNSLPTTPHRQDSLNTGSKSPLQPFDSAFLSKSFTTAVPDTGKAVMEPPPTPAGESIDSRVSRSSKREDTDPGQSKRSERESSQYDRARNAMEKTETQITSYRSLSPELLPTSPEPRSAGMKASKPHDRSSEVDENPHIHVMEPVRAPEESSTRISRPPIRSFRSKIPGPWDRQLAKRKSGDEHRREVTPDRGSAGQFWTSHHGAEMERKWFGRHGSGEGCPGPGDDFVP